jgi:long-chain fatty acid transport protein
MSIYWNNSVSKTLLAIGIASVSVVTQAGSFGLIEQSASGQGSAYAGASAIAEDASTIYFNPAGMTRLSGQQIVAAGHIISPDADFTNNGSFIFDGVTASPNTLSGGNSSTGDPAFVPNFYYTTELNNGVHIGVGVNVPFGLSTEYDDGWVGRYNALRSEISSVNINPSIAWKVSKKVSVGFGLSVQYIDLELTNNIDSLNACANIVIAGGNPPAACNAPPPAGPGLAAAGDVSRDSHLKLDADSTEIGWNTGILIDVTGKDRIGVSYRSAIKHNVSGSADYTLDPGLQAIADGATGASGFNILQDTPLDATADLPETFSVSYVRDFDRKWTLLADWTHTGWSSLDSIVIVQQGGVPGSEPTLELDYDNTSRYSVGVHFKPDNRWVYRGGLAYDETPIQSAEKTTARIPGNDRKWLSVGLGYMPSLAWSLDIGFSHLFINDTDINNIGSTTSGATLKGTFESSVDIISAQANYNF